MCGILGVVNPRGVADISDELFAKMLFQIEHRGPDEFGMCRGNEAILGNTRLSIIDLSHGRQPIPNHDGSAWVVLNGEIFNHEELHADLASRGHRFRTRCDTEVLLPLYAEKGEKLVDSLRGQYGFAIWDDRKKMLLLGRDRPGVRPVFYHLAPDGTFYFASEIKAILADPRVARELDHRGLDQIVQFWTNVGGLTAFKGIRELPPGHILVFQNGNIRIERYWDYSFPMTKPARKPSVEESVERLDTALRDAVRIRLKADVPVGTYVSGGIDSTVTTYLAAQYTKHRLRTYAVEFEDPAYDESSYQQELAKMLGTEHHAVRVTYDAIAQAFPDVIWHAEKPLFRTAPTPLFLLSKLVRETGYKVVLTGEGSDEVLWGYDTFKEHRVRLFWRKNPDSNIRPQLLKKLFPQYKQFGEKNYEMIKRFYRKSLEPSNPKIYSHTVRWENNKPVKNYFSPQVKASLQGWDAESQLVSLLPPDYDRWYYLEQNQYLEVLTLLPGYLLSSQGDRMSMAHAVEGRFPYLDHRTIEECAALPADVKLRVLSDKWVLRKAYEKFLPERLAHRPKHAYQAPDLKSFFYGNKPEYVDRLLAPQHLEKTGIFNPQMVSMLLQKFTAAKPEDVNYRDNLASVFILSTLLLHEQYIEHFKPRTPTPAFLNKLWKGRMDKPE